MSLDDALEWNLGGRYTFHGEIAAGGMATVHIGRMKGTAGFSKMVAIKRLHAQYAKDPDFVSMFLDEARLAARVHHPNVVQPLDVIAEDGEVFLVMEYVRGESLSKLLRALVPRGDLMPVKIAAAIMVGVLHGLHAAHEATNERGEKLGIVHRDMSPQNVLVGTDGIARVLDFGIAKAETRSYQTRDGDLKGKLAYMSPEQLTGESPVDRRTDIFAASIVLWEVLTGRRLFDSDYQSAILARVRSPDIEPPSKYVSDLPKQLDELVLRGLSRDPTNRFTTAREMAILLETCLPLATPSRVGEWVEEVAAENLAARSVRIAEIEKGLAPDVVEESKEILQGLKDASKSRKTSVERGRGSFVDGREAARTPISSGKPVGRPDRQTSRPDMGSLPAPPSDREKAAARVSAPPRDELPPPRTSSPKIVDLPSDDLMTSHSAVFSPGMMAEVRRPSVTEGTGNLPKPPPRSTSPSFSDASRRVPQQSLVDPPSGRENVPSSGPRTGPKSGPHPAARPPRVSITGANVHEDIPNAPVELAAPRVDQFSLPEIPPMQKPVDLKTDYQGNKKPTSSSFPVLLILLALAAVGAYFALPTVVEQVYVGAAQRRGIALKVDRVEVTPHVIRLFGVNATASDLPGVFVRAAEVDFNIRDSSPPTMTATGVDATVNGPYGSMRDALDRYLTVHPLREGDDSSKEALRTIIVEKGHFTWGGIAGANTKLEAEEVSGKIDKVEGHSLGEDLAFESPRFSATSAIGTIGPYDAKLGVGPFSTRIDVVMLPSSPGAAELHYSDQANAGVQIDGKITRATIDALGMPRGMFGLKVDESMQIEGSVHYARPGLTKVDAEITAGFYGAKLHDAQAPVDIRFQAGISGDPSTPIVINNGVILFGSLRGEIWGKTTITPDAVRVDASWRTAPRSCAQIAGIDNTTIAQVAGDPIALDRQVNAIAGGSQTFVSGAFTLDTRDLGSTVITAAPSTKCAAKIFSP